MAHPPVAKLKTKSWFAEVQRLLFAPTPSRVGWLIADKIEGMKDPERSARDWAKGRIVPTNYLNLVSQAAAETNRKLNSREKSKLCDHLIAIFLTGPDQSYLWDALHPHDDGHVLTYHLVIDPETPAKLDDAISQSKGGLPPLQQLACAISASNHRLAHPSVADVWIADAARAAEGDLARYNLSPDEVIVCRERMRDWCTPSNHHHRLAMGWQ